MVSVSSISMQGLAGDLYPISNGIEDVDRHLVALGERYATDPGLRDVYEHDSDLLLDLRRVLERLHD